MRDEGLINSDEPFIRLLSQGMVLNQGVKMSKSKGNTVDPQALIQRYGVDTLRLFSMFAAPPEQSLEWSDSGVEGAFRFLKRLWTYCFENSEAIQQQNRLLKAGELNKNNWENADPEQLEIFRQLYLVVDQAKYDYERQQYNTVVSGCMKILNFLTKLEPSKAGYIDIRQTIIHKGISVLLRLLAPVTPHITHQLWIDLDFTGTVLEANWPKSNSVSFKIDTIELVVQVNGKLRSKVRVPPDAEQTLIEKTVKSDEKVLKALDGSMIKKIIIVPGKLVNVVAGK